MTIPQNIKNTKPELDTEHLKAVASLIVNTQDDSKKASKKDRKELKSSTKTAKTSKKQRLSTVKNDIQVGKNHDLGSEGADAEGEQGSGIFGGFADHWEPDPLTLFMFENAPVLIELCQRSQDAMVKAQVTQTKLQAKNALSGAQETVAKGKAQAQQQNTLAAGEFAQAGVAALQVGLQCKDTFAGDDTYSKDLDAHDTVANGLNVAGEDSQTAGSEKTSLSEDEQAAIKAKAQNFKEAQKKYCNDEMGQRERGKNAKGEKTIAARAKSARTALKKNWCRIGLNRNRQGVEAENEILSNRAASRSAYEEQLAPNADPDFTYKYEKPTSENGDSIPAEGEISNKKFDGKLSNKEVSNLLEGKSNEVEGKETTTKTKEDIANEKKAILIKAKEARKLFMKELFDENSPGTEKVSMQKRMDLVGDWGTKGDVLKKELLASYGGTEEGIKMSKSFEETRNGAISRAKIETDLNQKILNTRQILLQNFASGGIKALSDFLQKKYTIAQSQHEAASSIDSSLSQMYGQAKGSEDTFIANSIKDMTGIFEWFQSMHGQLISAQTSAAGV